MVGPNRAWFFTIDPDHAWLMNWNPARASGSPGGSVRMAIVGTDSPLLQMVETTPADYWNDSCAVAELAYAVDRGATGATSNPTIVGEVMKKEKDHWVPRVREIAAENPTWSEVEITWSLIEEMGIRGAGILAPVFEREDRRKGRLSLQTNPANYRDPQRMADQAVHFSTPWRRTSRSSSRPRRPAWSASRTRPRAAWSSTPPWRSACRRPLPRPRPWSAGSTASRAPAATPAGSAPSAR